MRNSSNLTKLTIQKKAVWGRSLVLALLAALLATPAAAQTTDDITAKFDDAVREAWASGAFSRVIMRFATIEDRDRGYSELLDKGAAVRVMDDEGTPTLNVFASPSAFGSIDHADRVSFDAPVQVSAAVQARAKFVRGNGRGNGALRKIGAVQEGLLRRSFLRNGQYHDQVLWGILVDDWRLQRLPQVATVTH